MDLISGLGHVEMGRPSGHSAAGEVGSPCDYGAGEEGVGTAVLVAGLSCPLRRSIDRDRAGEDVGSGGAHESVGRARSWPPRSRHGVRLEERWCLVWAERLLQLL